MYKWTRRDFLKSSVAATAGARALPLGSLTARGANTEAAGPPASPEAALSTRERLLLDFHWRFHLGHADDPARDFGYGRGDEYMKTGVFFRPSRPNFNDSGWRAIDLPHDWAVELPFQNDKSVIDHGAKALGRSYPGTSIGWYRRVFKIPQSDFGKRLSIEFDGVFRDSMVALNGNFLGRNMSGYAPFAYDITDQANYGGKNVLVVRVDSTVPEGWFYEGAGIYRHVWLVKTNPLHVPQWGTFVTSEVKESGAVVTVKTEVANEADGDATCQVISTIVDQAGSEVASDRSDAVSIPGWGHREVAQRLQVTNPGLWSIEQPNLYRLVTTIETGGSVGDRYETPFGIRTIRFDADQGFYLNGKPVKIKGTCNHQDHAGVGSALPDRLQFYRIEKLKEMGSNGYRTSHNPPTPELLDACDQLGMLVLDETRRFASDRESLSQLSRMIRRDRNHPCVVFWSTGNEEDLQGSELGARLCATMKRLVRRLDPTRLITQAMDGGWGHGISAVLDVQGFNYKHAREIDDFHAKFPAQPCVGSETGSTVSTRGIYANDKEKGYVSAYDLNFPEWASTAEEWWQTYDQRAFLSGGFVWTGFDYRGEPTPYSWPCISSHFGLMDTCGFPKDNFYYYQAWWGSKPVLHLFPHWNWPGKEGQEIEVWVHTNLERVELFLNGQSLGSKPVKRDSHLAWKVKYAPGTLQARGYQGGQEALAASRETTGAPAKIELRPDRQRIAADGEDVSILEVRVVDHQGRVVPTADNEMVFQVSGAGKLIGVGNGDPSSHEPDKASQRHAFNGLCVAIVQSKKEAGEIKVQATSPGLASTNAVIQCEQAAPRPAVA
ncbi:MAG TPA: beta-galactosidase GalA [Terriglobia bacterium]|nr:beta-galactosidase GalA [Terriglobia bacterium]